MIAIKQRLQRELERVLNQLKEESMSTKEYQFNRIPLTLQIQGNKLNYRSAIALSLAGKQSQRGGQIAAEIINKLNTQISPDFAKIQGSPPAWIDLTLTRFAIGEWLQQSCLHTSRQLMSLSPSERIESLPQYVRVRCCQLLQLGSLENFVSFRHSQGSWSGVLIQDQTLLTQGDWELLYQLIATRDRLEEVSTHQQREKLAYHLSYAVLEFHRHCQLFNQQQSDFRQVAIIRFSAIAIAAQLLSNCGY